MQIPSIVIESHELVELAQEVQAQGLCDTQDYPTEVVAAALGRWLETELTSLTTDVAWSLRRNRQTFLGFLPTELNK